MRNGGVTQSLDAPQHGPRPLPLFLEILRNETAASPERRAAALAGLRAYQDAPRRNVRLAAARWRRGAARLRDYGGDGRPVVFVPSLINPAFVLDLAPDNSLLRWLRTQGMRPLLVDWGTPLPADRDRDVAGHVTDRLLPLLSRLDESPVLVGYCLGGTMALAAAGLRDVAGLAMIATPWRFDGFGAATREEIGRLWMAAKPTCDSLGLVPMEVLQTGFWRLDPGRTIRKYEAFGALDPADRRYRAFVALEDWANAGAPLTYGAGRELFEDLLAGNATGTGAWRVGGRAVDPAALACPAIEFVSRTDRITPAASAAGIGKRHALDLGHVGMIVGSAARARLWEPLARWINALPRTR